MFKHSNDTKENENVMKCVHEHDEDVKNAVKLMPSDETVCDLSDFYKAISDSTRLKILWSLQGGELCVCCISEVVGMSISAVSHQLKTLKRANLIKSRESGKNVYYSLNDEHVKTILEVTLEHLME